MRAFISGKITGDANFREKFADAETVVMNLGYDAMNPAWIPDGVEYETCMRICFAMIDAANIVVRLPDWYRSAGSQRECMYALEHGIPVREYEHLVADGLRELKGEHE